MAKSTKKKENRFSQVIFLVILSSKGFFRLWIFQLSDFDPDASWDKDQLGDVLHWIRQVVGLICGLLWGSIPLVGGIWIIETEEETRANFHHSSILWFNENHTSSQDMSRWYQSRKIYSDVPFYWVLTIDCEQRHVSSEIVLACFR